MSKFRHPADPEVRNKLINTSWDGWFKRVRLMEKLAKGELRTKLSKGLDNTASTIMMKG